MEPYGTLAQYKKFAILKKHNAYVEAWAAEMALGVATVFWATWADIEKQLPEGDEPLDDVTGWEAMQTIGEIVSKAVQGNSTAMVEVLQAYQYKGWLCGAVEQARRTNSLGFFLNAREQLDSRFYEADTITVQADETGWVNLPNQRAVEYAQDHAAEMVTNIDETTREIIAKIVQGGVANGASYNDIAKQIKEKFEDFATPKPQQHIENRAVLVAVTELANAYCAGSFAEGDYLQSQGLEMMKIWQTVEDDRVSDGCKENQAAGWIRHDELFPSGHEHPPRFPGCRCDFLEDMLDEKALGKSYVEYEQSWEAEEDAEYFTGQYNGKGSISVEQADQIKQNADLSREEALTLDQYTSSDPQDTTDAKTQDIVARFGAAAAALTVGSLAAVGILAGAFSTAKDYANGETLKLSPTVLSICDYCKYKRSGDKCEAYPDGIPKRFLDGSADHITSYRGDGGITFSPKR